MQRVVSVMRPAPQQQVMVCTQVFWWLHRSVTVQVRVMVLGQVPVTTSLEETAVAPPQLSLMAGQPVTFASG